MYFGWADSGKNKPGTFKIQFAQERPRVTRSFLQGKFFKINCVIQKEGILIRKEEQSDDNRFSSMHKWASQLIELQRQIETKVQ